MADRRSSPRRRDSRRSEYGEPRASTYNDPRVGNYPNPNMRPTSYDPEPQRTRAHEPQLSSSSSSSSSYLDISRHHQTTGSRIRAFFTTPSEKKKVRRRRSRRSFFKFGNNSSSSVVNDDMAYGTGFIKVSRRRSVRSRNGKERVDGGRYSDREGKNGRRKSITNASRTNLSDGGRQSDLEGKGGRRSATNASRTNLDDGGRYSEREGGRISRTNASRMSQNDEARYSEREGGRVTRTNASRTNLNDGGRYSDREGGRVSRSRTNRSSAATEAELLALGAGLAKIARESNKADLRGGRSGSGRGSEIFVPRENRRTQETSRGLGPSKVSHGSDNSDDDDGWESASDDESESSVDMRLAYSNDYNKRSWGLFGRKKYKPLSRKDSVVDPKLFGPQNSLNGVIAKPVGFGEVSPWTSTSDFGQTNELDLTPRPAPPPDRIPSLAPEQSFTSSQGSLKQVFPMPTDDPRRFDAGRGSIISEPRYEPPRPSMAPGPEPLHSSRPGPIPIQQPQPITPVSQRVYEPVYKPQRSEVSDSPSRTAPSSIGRQSFAEVALAGVAGATAGAALASSRDGRKDRRRDEEREEEERLRRREAEKRDREERRQAEEKRDREDRLKRQEEDRRRAVELAEKKDREDRLRRQEAERKEREDRRRAEELAQQKDREDRLRRQEEDRRRAEELAELERERLRREKKDSKDKDKRRDKDRKKDDADDSRRDKKRDKRRDEKTRSERSDRPDVSRSDAMTDLSRSDTKSDSKRTMGEAPISVAAVDPFQYQVHDDAFPTPTAEDPLGHRKHDSVPTVVTVEREPDFSKIRNFSSKDQPEPRRSYMGYDDRDYSRDSHGDRALHEGEALYEEIKHSTAPFDPAIIGAADATVLAEDERRSRSEKRRLERRRGDQDYDEYESRDTKPRDPIQEEADRAYREIVMARKIASQVIRSRSASPDHSIIDKYDAKDGNGEEIVRIVTPPGMESHKQTGLYDAPNADFRLDYVMEHPKELHTFNIPAIDLDNSYPDTLKKDPDAERPRPFLNLVRPTPTPSPAPEKQESRRRSSRSADRSEPQRRQSVDDVVIGPKGDIVSSPTASAISKGVTWGENEMKHYEVETPSEQKDEFVSKSDNKSRDISSKPEAKPIDSSKKRGWGAIAAGVMSGGVAAAATNSSETSSSTKTRDISQARDSPKTVENEKPIKGSYEYRGVVVEPEEESPRSQRRRSPPSMRSNEEPASPPLKPRKESPPLTGPKPAAQSTHIPGAFDDDLDFTAHVAAGLQDTGFDPNIVINDPSFRRRESPPGSNGPTLYHAPYAETVTDLGVSGNQPHGFVIGEVASTPRDWQSVSPMPQPEETPTKLSKKEQKKRDKERNQSEEVTPIEPSSTSREVVEEPEAYFEPKLSKKEQKKRDRAAKSINIVQDVTDAPEPAIAEKIVEEPDTYVFETPKKSKKKSKRSSIIEDGVEEASRESQSVPLPVETFNDIQRGEDEWTDSVKSKKSKRDSERYSSPSRSVATSEAGTELSRSSSKKSKDRSKRDSERYESPPRSVVVSEASTEPSRSSSKKSKEKSKRRDEQYEEDPTEVSLPPSTPSETSRDGDYDDSRKSRKSSTKDSGIFSSADRGESRSVVSAGTSRYDDDTPKKKKKSKSSGRDDYDDTRSIASAPVGDDYDDKKSKKKDKDKEKRSSGLWGIFGSKSESGVRDESPKRSKDDFEEKKSKKSKRSSVPDGSGIYGDIGATSIGDLSRSVSGGHGTKHQYEDYEDGTRSDGEPSEKKRKSKSRSQSVSSKKDSFLDNADILGADVGIVDVPAAISAQENPQSKAANADSSKALQDTLERELSKPSVFDYEVKERQFRPSIDPQYGDLLPLPPSDPSTPEMETLDDLPELPDSRPETPESERISRDKSSMSAVRRSLQETPVKSPSQSSIPLAWRFASANRAGPSSPGPARSSPLQSPSTPNPEAVLSRSRSRPKSWDGKEYRPLFLVESTRRRNSTQLDEKNEDLPALPESQTTSRSSSQMDLARPDDWQLDARRTLPDLLSINTALATAVSSELLDSEQSTPKAGEISRNIDTIEPHGSTRAENFSEEPSRHILQDAALIGVAGASIFDGRSPPEATESSSDELPSIQRQPSPVDPMTKERSSYLLKSSPSKQSDDLEGTDRNFESPTRQGRDILRSIDENQSSDVFATLGGMQAEHENSDVVAIPDDIRAEREKALETLSGVSALEASKTREIPEEKEPAEGSVSKKSKKDKKKDKKKAKSPPAWELENDESDDKLETELQTLPEVPAWAAIQQAEESIPKTDRGLAGSLSPFDSEQVDESSSSTSKKSKKKIKKGKSTALLDKEEQIESPIVTEVPSTGTSRDPLKDMSPEKESQPEGETLTLKKDKKKGKKKDKSVTSSQDEEEQTQIPTMMESATEASRSLSESATSGKDAQIGDENSVSIAKEDKKKSKKKGKSIASWNEGDTTSSSSSAASTPAEDSSDNTIKDILDRSETAAITPDDEISFPGSKKDKKKDKKPRSTMYWESEENARSTPPISRDLTDEQPTPSEATSEDFSATRSKRDKKKKRKSVTFSEPGDDDQFSDLPKEPWFERDNEFINEPVSILKEPSWTDRHDDSDDFHDAPVARSPQEEPIIEVNKNVKDESFLERVDLPVDKPMGSKEILEPASTLEADKTELVSDAKGHEAEPITVMRVDALPENPELVESNKSISTEIEELEPKLEPKEISSAQDQLLLEQERQEISPQTFEVSEKNDTPTTPLLEADDNQRKPVVSKVDELGIDAPETSAREIEAIVEPPVNEAKTTPHDLEPAEEKSLIEEQPAAKEVTVTSGKKDKKKKKKGKSAPTSDAESSSAPLEAVAKNIGEISEPEVSQATTDDGFGSNQSKKGKKKKKGKSLPLPDPEEGSSSTTRELEAQKESVISSEKEKDVTQESQPSNLTESAPESQDKSVGDSGSQDPPVTSHLNISEPPADDIKKEQTSQESKSSVELEQPEESKEVTVLVEEPKRVESEIINLEQQAPSEKLLTADATDSSSTAPAASSIPAKEDGSKDVDNKGFLTRAFRPAATFFGFGSSKKEEPKESKSTEADHSTKSLEVESKVPGGDVQEEEQKLTKEPVDKSVNRQIEAPIISSEEAKPSPFAEEPVIPQTEKSTSNLEETQSRLPLGEPTIPAEEAKTVEQKPVDEPIILQTEEPTATLEETQSTLPDGLTAGYKDEQLSLARQLQEEFNRKPSKKDKKKRRSLPSTPEPESSRSRTIDDDPENHLRARSLSIGPSAIRSAVSPGSDDRKSVYTEEQLELARQLKEEFGSGSKKSSKKDKKNRSRSTTRDASPFSENVEPAQAIPTEIPREASRSDSPGTMSARDGLDAGYQEEQLSLARQLQSEFGKKSGKKDKKRRSTSQTPQEQEPRNDYFGEAPQQITSEPLPIEEPPTVPEQAPEPVTPRDGLAVGYNEEQLELARQLKEEFGSGSKKGKKDKKDKKRQSLLRSNTDDGFSSDPYSRDADESNVQTPQPETADESSKDPGPTDEPEDYFTTPSKKSKKDKKGKKRETLSQSNNEDDFSTEAPSNPDLNTSESSKLADEAAADPEADFAALSKKSKKDKKAKNRESLSQSNNEDDVSSHSLPKGDLETTETLRAEEELVADPETDLTPTNKKSKKDKKGKKREGVLKESADDGLLSDTAAKEVEPANSFPSEAAADADAEAETSTVDKQVTNDDDFNLPGKKNKDKKKKRQSLLVTEDTLVQPEVDESSMLDTTAASSGPEVINQDLNDSEFSSKKSKKDKKKRKSLLQSSAFEETKESQPAAEETLEESTSGDVKPVEENITESPQAEEQHNDLESMAKESTTATDIVPSFSTEPTLVQSIITEKESEPPTTEIKAVLPEEPKQELEVEPKALTEEPLVEAAENNQEEQSQEFASTKKSKKDKKKRKNSSKFDSEDTSGYSTPFDSVSEPKEIAEVPEAPTVPSELPVEVAAEHIEPQADTEIKDSELAVPDKKSKKDKKKKRQSGTSTPLEVVAEPVEEASSSMLPSNDSPLEESRQLEPESDSPTILTPTEVSEAPAEESNLVPEKKSKKDKKKKRNSLKIDLEEPSGASTPLEDPSEPTETILSSDNTAIEKPKEPVEQLENPIEQPIEPIVQLEEPVEQPEKPIEQLEEPIAQPEEPIVQPEEPVEQLEQEPSPPTILAPAEVSEAPADELDSVPGKKSKRDKKKKRNSQKIDLDEPSGASAPLETSSEPTEIAAPTILASDNTAIEQPEESQLGQEPIPPTTSTLTEVSEVPVDELDPVPGKKSKKDKKKKRNSLKLDPEEPSGVVEPPEVSAPLENPSEPTEIASSAILTSDNITIEQPEESQFGQEPIPPTILTPAEAVEGSVDEQGPATVKKSKKDKKKRNSQKIDLEEPSGASTPLETPEPIEIIPSAILPSDNTTIIQPAEPQPEQEYNPPVTSTPTEVVEGSVDEWAPAIAKKSKKDKKKRNSLKLDPEESSEVAEPPGVPAPLETASEPTEIVSSAILPSDNTAIVRPEEPQSEQEPNPPAISTSTEVVEGSVDEWAPAIAKKSKKDKKKKRSSTKSSSAGPSGTTTPLEPIEDLEKVQDDIPLPNDKTEGLVELTQENSEGHNQESRSMAPEELTEGAHESPKEATEEPHNMLVTKPKESIQETPKEHTEEMRDLAPETPLEVHEFREEQDLASHSFASEELMKPTHEPLEKPAEEPHNLAPRELVESVQEPFDKSTHNAPAEGSDKPLQNSPEEPIQESDDLALEKVATLVQKPVEEHAQEARGLAPEESVSPVQEPLEETVQEFHSLPAEELENHIQEPPVESTPEFHELAHEKVAKSLPELHEEPHQFHDLPPEEPANPVQELDPTQESHNLAPHISAETGATAIPADVEITNKPSEETSNTELESDRAVTTKKSKKEKKKKKSGLSTPVEDNLYVDSEHIPESFDQPREPEEVADAAPKEPSEEIAEDWSRSSKKSKKDKKKQRSGAVTPAAEPVAVAVTGETPLDAVEQIGEQEPSEQATSSKKVVESILQEPVDEGSLSGKKPKRDKKKRKSSSTPVEEILPQEIEYPENPESAEQEPLSLPQTDKETLPSDAEQPAPEEIKAVGESKASEETSPSIEESKAEEKAQAKNEEILAPPEIALDGSTPTTAELPQEAGDDTFSSKKSKKNKKKKSGASTPTEALSTAETEQPNLDYTPRDQDPLEDGASLQDEPKAKNDEHALPNKKSNKDKKKRKSELSMPIEGSSSVEPEQVLLAPEEALEKEVKEPDPIPAEEVLEPQEEERDLSSKKSTKDKKKHKSGASTPAEQFSSTEVDQAPLAPEQSIEQDIKEPDPVIAEDSESKDAEWSQLGNKSKKDKKKRKSGMSTPVEEIPIPKLEEDTLTSEQSISRDNGEAAALISTDAAIDQQDDEFSLPGKKSKKDKKKRKSGVSTPAEEIPTFDPERSSAVPEESIQRAIVESSSISTEKAVVEEDGEWAVPGKKSKKDKKKRNSGLFNPIEESNVDKPEPLFVESTSIPSTVAADPSVTKIDQHIVEDNVQPEEFIPGPIVQDKYDIGENLPNPELQESSEEVMRDVPDQSREATFSTDIVEEPANYLDPAEPAHVIENPASQPIERASPTDFLEQPLSQPVDLQISEDLVEEPTSQLADRPTIREVAEDLSSEPVIVGARIRESVDKREVAEQLPNQPIEISVPREHIEEPISRLAETPEFSKVVEEPSRQPDESISREIVDEPPQTIDTSVADKTAGKTAGEPSNEDLESLTSKKSKKDKKKKRKSGTSTQIEDTVASQSKENVTAEATTLPEQPIISKVNVSEAHRGENPSGIAEGESQELHESTSQGVTDEAFRNPVDNALGSWSRDGTEPPAAQQELVEEPFGIIRKKSKKDKKGKRAASQAESQIGPSTSAPARVPTPELPVVETSPVLERERSVASPVPFEELRTESHKITQDTEHRPPTPIIDRDPTHHGETNDDLGDVSRSSSKKEKRKRQTTVDTKLSEGSSSSKPSLTSWADEIEEASVVRQTPVIEDIAKDDSLSHIASTTPASNLDDFVRPTKKGKKGSKKKSLTESTSASDSFLEPASDSHRSISEGDHSVIVIPGLIAAGAGATTGAALLSKVGESHEETPPKLARKLSKKEKRKQSIDKRSPTKDDIFDDPALWEGEKPRSYEEEKGGENDAASDGFWSPPQEELPSIPDPMEDIRPTTPTSKTENKGQLALPIIVTETSHDHQIGGDTLPSHPTPALETSHDLPKDRKLPTTSEHGGSFEISQPPTTPIPSRTTDLLHEKDIDFKDTPPILQRYISPPPQGFSEPQSITRSFSPQERRAEHSKSPFRSSRFSQVGFSDLPVVDEEENPQVEHQTALHIHEDINRDSAFVGEPPNPHQKGFTDNHEHVRDSGVHLRDVSPAKRTIEPISSSDAAIERLSWPQVDEESETVNLHRSQRPQRDAISSTPRHEDTREVPENQDSPTLPRGRKLIGSDRAGRSSSSKHETGDATTRDMSSPKSHEENPIELQTPASLGKPRERNIVGRRLRRFQSPEEDLEEQKVQNTQSPDAPRSQKPKEDKYGELISSRPKAEKPRSFSDLEASAAIAGASLGFSAARRRSAERRPSSVQSQRSLSNINRLRTPDLKRPESSASNRSGTPPLRRTDRQRSGDLRSLSQQSKPDLAKEAELAAAAATPSISNTPNPQANEGRVRAKDMADVYDGFGEGRMGSPRSPTRPHSMRRRQSMQVLDLESKVEQLVAENRRLAEEKVQAERAAQSKSQTSSSLVEKESEIDSLKRTLDWLHKEVSRLTEINEGLTSANLTIARQHSDKYGALETQHIKATQELQEARDAHTKLSTGMEGVVRGEVQKAVQNAVSEKDREIAELRAELDVAREKIREMQRQILASKANDTEFLTVRDEDYFDNACQQLCQHVQQWVLRFSKFSDMRACRLTSEINNDKTIDRLDNAVLDGSDVDIYLSDRVKRRDIFMSMTMTMVWEFIFTRYLFGMDREQRQKLKSLEKTLSEVGPVSAVHTWRATTLTLLAKRPAFVQQRSQDTQAVVHAIIETLSEILPPPSHLEGQIEEQLTRVMKSAVDLSIEMRCQRAEYMMLPPLQPEYDANGDLASKVTFNAALMNERSGDTISNEDLEAQRAVVRIVLFPLVVKKGDDSGEGEEEIVVCPAQVLVAKPKKVRISEGDNRSRVSMQSNMPMTDPDNVI